MMGYGPGRAVVHGAREHNLKDVTVRLPRNKLICITGLSGSGKSSLAFDTIYAEGQRRYVESLSAYARQFLQMMEKPDVDSIDGLSPAISIDQKTTSRNPRSTVGTVTEIYDYLRLLYARVGRPHCPVCGRPVAGQSLDAIVDQVLRLEEGTKFTVNAPVVRDRKGEFKDVLEELRADGFTRVKVDGEQRLLEEEIVLDKKFKHAIEVIVDRLVMKADLRQRLAQSIETAAGLADGLVAVDVVDTGEQMLFSENFACPDHGVSLPELEPRIFSFNSPHGACPRCTGLGAQLEVDPDLVVPDPRLSIGEGALVPWSVMSSNFYESVIQAIADRYEIDLETPWNELPEEQRDRFLHGTDGERVYVQYRNRMGRKRSYMLSFEGIVKSLERRYRETDSAQIRERIEEYMSFRACPDCGGARLKPEVLAVTVGERNIHEFTRMSVTARARVPRRARADGGRAADRRADRQGDPRAADVPRRRRRRLPHARPRRARRCRAARRSGCASRRRSARSSSACSTSSTSRRSGSTSATTARLIGTLERLRDLGNTVLVVEHDEQMMRSADWLVDMGPGAGEHGGYVVAEGPAKKVERIRGLDHRPVPLRQRARSPCPSGATDDSGTFRVRGARMHNLKEHRRRVPGRQARLRHRRLRLRQVDARQRDRLQGAREPAAPDAREAGRPRRGRGHRLLRQGDRHRPVADRPHAALEPGHLHRPVHADPRALLADARGEGARLQARPVLVQRARRSLRDLQGRRPDQDRDALPAGRLRAVRDVPRPALQPRDARGSLQGQVDRRRARDVRRGGAAVLREDPEDPPQAADAARRRARLHQARAAGDDALRRRGAAGEAREGALEGRDRAGRSTSSTSRRPASTSPTSRSCSRCSNGSSTRGTPCS